MSQQAQDAIAEAVSGPAKKSSPTPKV